MNHLSLDGPVGRSGKSESAFRTISEVSADLGVPQHVLRFWETRFSQIRPMKRGGGRRYYRPEDIRILEAIRDLLYNDGYTIRGAQKLLRENGLKSILAAQADGGAETLPVILPPEGGLDEEALSDEEGVFIAFNSDMENASPVPSSELSDVSDAPPLSPDLNKEPEDISATQDPVPDETQDVGEDPDADDVEDGLEDDDLEAENEGGEDPSLGLAPGLDHIQRGELDETLRELEDLRRILRQAGL